MPDQEALVPLALLTRYLTARGWNPVAQWRGTSVWEQGQADSDQVLLPLDVGTDSSRSLLRKTVGDIAIIEQRPLQQLLLELASPHSDTQVFHVYPPTRSGTIPLSSGRRVVDAIYKLMQDAGRNESEGHRLLYRNRVSAQVGRFLGRVEFDVTRPGSYVFITRTSNPSSTGAIQPELPDWDPQILPRADPTRRPLLAAIADTDVASPDDTFDHRITQRLHDAVQQAHRVARIMETDGTVEDVSEPEISANFCKALAELGGMDHNRPFKIGFSWGFGRREMLADESFKFTGNMSANILSFGEKLERFARTGRATITGFVTGLIQETSGQHRVQIRGQVLTDQGESNDALWVLVNDTDYDRSITAHQDGIQVRVEGRLTFDNKRLRFQPGSRGIEFFV